MQRRWARYSLNVQKLTKPGRHLNNYSTACPLIFTVCLLPLYTVHCLTYHTVHPPLMYHLASVIHSPSYILSNPLFILSVPPLTNCPSPHLQTVRPPYYKLSVPPVTYCPSPHLTYCLSPLLPA